MTDQEILEAVELELVAARLKFPRFASAHEGYAVISEEMDELWEEIRDQEGSKTRLYREALQVAAMAVRFIKDVCCD